MNARFSRIGTAIASILIASIVAGGTILFLGALMYRSLVDSGSPRLALTFLVISACGVGALAVFIGQSALRRALQWRQPESRSADIPTQVIAGELARLINNQPVTLVFASLGVGFILGLSPRIRRTVYRSLID
jgi:hypothetical protein